MRTEGEKDGVQNDDSNSYVEEKLMVGRREVKLWGQRRRTEVGGRRGR